MGLILRDVDVDGRRVSVRVERGVIASIAEEHRHAPTDDVVDGAGGALLPGLHDHHVHVLAFAAARASVDVGPAARASGATFASTLRSAARHGPVRAVGYHDALAGPLDRDALDALVPDVAVRVQHRTGGLWILNTSALEQIPPELLVDPRFERGDGGRLSGRLWRGDELVRGDHALPAGAVAAVGAELAALGVTAITDATVSNDAGRAALLRGLPQRVRAMGPLELALDESEQLTLGEVKVLLDDDDLPPFDTICALVRRAHERGRGVAVHCVTLVQVRYAIEVFRVAGVRADRIEHASVAPPDIVADLRALGLTVVTQPGFVRARGDDYLADVDPRDVDALYPVASLLAAGVATRGSSDAPFGPLDPWQAMRAGVDRRTASGRTLTAAERVSPAAALALYLGRPALCGGDPADLVLLACPARDALHHLCAEAVVLTTIGGRVVHDAR